MKRKKAQMFLVTIVFLSGIIFAVQGFLAQYMVMDLSEPMQKNDIYILSSIRDMFTDTMTTSYTCDDALRNVQTLHYFLIRQAPKGYTVEFKYNKLPDPNVDCAYWVPGATEPVLNLTIHVTSTETETTGVYEFYRE